MNLRTPGIAIITACFLMPGLSGCRDSDASAKEAACDRCGVIESIDPREIKGDPSALGTIAGAVVGGVVGHQFGSGRGNDVATVGGAVGGAFAGREVEKEVKKKLVYDITVRMESGELRTLTRNSAEGLRPGDHVEVTGNQIVRSA